MGHDLFVQMLIILDAADTFTHCLPSFSFLDILPRGHEFDDV